MLTLSEIADKMPTITEWWLLMFGISLFFLLLGVWHRWAGAFVAVFLLPACTWLAWSSYTQAYGGPIMSDIEYELGHTWIAHSIASSFLPLVLAACMVTGQYIMHLHKKTLRLRAFAPSRLCVRQ